VTQTVFSLEPVAVKFSRALKKSVVAPIVSKRADYSSDSRRSEDTCSSRDRRSRREILLEVLFAAAG
jgi:hypothetical protein